MSYTIFTLNGYNYILNYCLFAISYVQYLCFIMVRSPKNCAAAGWGVGLAAHFARRATRLGALHSGYRNYSGQTITSNS